MTFKIGRPKQRKSRLRTPSKTPRPKRLVKSLSDKTTLSKRSLSIRGAKSRSQIVKYPKSSPINLTIQIFVENVIVEPKDPITLGRIKILFFSANPKDTDPLQLAKEEREIITKLRSSELRDSIDFITRAATRPDDLIQALLEHKPHIVHFSGHGSSTEELKFVDETGNAKLVGKDALVKLFGTLKNNIRVVLLNACFSCPQAKAITSEIDCAIGMQKEIGDDAAIMFAGSFYRGIGFGYSVEDAFHQGITALMIEGILEEKKTPKLICRKGIDAKLVILSRKK